MDEITWNTKHGREEPGTRRDQRRLALCEALLGQIATGVAVLAPRSTQDRSLELVMLNEVAAIYFGWLGPLCPSDSEREMLADAYQGLSESGLLGLAELVSLTGHMHTQEGVAVPGAAVAGHVVDLCITPADGAGAVSLTFVDVTHRVSQSH